MPPGDERHALDVTSEMTLPPPGPAFDGLCPGAMLGQYRLLEHIGAGGMGHVFKAVHPTMQRTVAVKVMAPALVQDPRARARFLREVRSAARLSHPNIVLAYDAAEEAGRCFLVMEYVEGRDAAALLSDYGPAPVAVACDVIRQAALGLQHAHEQGMVHRDIKPSNLVLAARPPLPPGWPAAPLVKVLDFGLARFQAGDSDPAVPVPGSTPLTREGHVVGTPEFMAPEQACNSRHTDIRADVYSLGCTFYCLLTGRPPFTGPSLLEVMVQHLQSPPPPVSLSRPDVPAAVVAVLERMLAKRPEDRYQQPAEVARALRPWVPAPSPVPAEAVVAPGRPINLLPPTASDTAELPAPGGPATPATAPEAPRRGAIARAVTATARAVLGCLALFLLLIASMIAGWVFLMRADRGAPQSTEPGGPPPRAEMVRFVADRFQPSYAPKALAPVPHDFEIAVTEVTREQFRAFARGAPYATAAERGDDRGRRGALVLTPEGTGGWSDEATWDAGQPALPGDAPVTCVTWEDAVRYCNWLSEREKLRPCYELRGGSGGWACDFGANGYRLPTEAEWEYAARAGEPTLYPEPERALRAHGWFREDSGGGPHPVGQKRKNPRELYDVWGNVWEWCWDRYAATPPQGPLLPPHGPETGPERVARGGGWCDPAPASPAATRKGLAPDHRANDLGFRVARTPP